MSPTPVCSRARSTSTVKDTCTPRTRSLPRATALSFPACMPAATCRTAAIARPLPQPAPVAWPRWKWRNTSRNTAVERENAMTSLRENLERLESAIEQACRRAGRSRSEIELMAVSKTYPAATICEAVSLGLHLFGENRVQEFAAKAADFAALHAAGSDAAPSDDVR